MYTLKKLLIGNRKIVFITACLVIFLAMLLISTLFFSEKHTGLVKETNTGDKAIISKAAVDKLVNQAADDKYLHDVLNDKTRLPISKRSTPLQPASDKTMLASEDIKNLNSQRCTFNNQLYASGDIVKTDKGWVRCMPTIIFLADNPTMPKFSNMVWILVQ